MEGDESAVGASIFGDVTLEDLANADPLKQIPALHKLLYEQANGKDYSFYTPILHKHCLVLGTGFNKDVRLLAYAAFKCMNLTEEQWSKLVPFLVGDVNGSDFDLKIAGIKMFEVMPTNLVAELINSAVDLLEMGRSTSRQASEEANHVRLRICALQTISTLLLYREGLQSIKGFLLSGWSLMVDRILNDPSRQAMKVAVEALSTLCAEIHRNSQHRMCDYSFPLAVPFFSNSGIPQRKPNFFSSSTMPTSSASGFSSSSTNDFANFNSFASSAAANPSPRDLFVHTGDLPVIASYFYESIESVNAPALRRRPSELDTRPPATPTTAGGSLAGTAPSSGTTQILRILTPLDKYAEVVMTKLLPHIYQLVNRCLWLEPSDLPPAILLVAVCLQQLEALTAQHTNIQVHFMTSPRHLIGEIVENFFFRLLNSKEDALVFEAASSLIHLFQSVSESPPSWILASCRALIGLVSRDSARSVMKRIRPLLLTSMKLVSPGVLLPVTILALQHIYKLQLPSSQRLPFFYEMLKIPLDLCETGKLSIASYFPSFLRHPWITSLINSTEEIPFREDLLGAFMKSLIDHWTKTVESEEYKHSQLSAIRITTSPAGESSATGGLTLSASLSESDNPIKKRRRGSAHLLPEQLSPAMIRVQQWRDSLFMAAVDLSKILQWKTHMRTFCITLYTTLIDTVSHALSNVRSARTQLRDMLSRSFESASHIRSDSLSIRLYYVILKHCLHKGMGKLVEGVYKVSQQRYLAWLDASRTPTKERILGYRVDQLCRTTLSNADLDVLVLILHMLSKHPVICEGLTDSTETSEHDLSSHSNPRLAAVLQYIELIQNYRSDDIVSTHRYSHLTSMANTHNIYNILSMMDGCTSTDSVKHQSNGNDLSPINTQTESLFIAPSVYVPPIEFMAKEAEKHADDEFLICYSKSRLPELSLFDSIRQNTYPSVLTSPSDPFLVHAYHVISTECARLTFFIRLTNLTKFQVPKVMVYVDTKGRLEPYNARSCSQTTFVKMEPGEIGVCQYAFKLNYMHTNELHVRLALVPSADKPFQTTDLHCTPYRINMNIMVMPWIINEADYFKEWTRYTNTLTFRAVLSKDVTVSRLDHAINQTYNRLLNWSYNDTFYLFYSGITWWDERILFTVSGSRQDEQSDYMLRVEARTSTLNLLVIIDSNKLQWLQDLTPRNPHWLSLSTDYAALRIFNNPIVSSAPSALDEQLMLDVWNKSRIK